MIDKERNQLVVCAFCSEPVHADQRVRYRGFITHYQCAKIYRKRRIEGFDRLRFGVGIAGSLGILLVSSPLLWLVLNSNNVSVLFFLDYSIDYQILSLTYILLMPCIGLIGIGIQGYSKNFNSMLAMAAVFLIFIASLLFGSTGSILSTFGVDPTYIDSTSGLFEYYEMPGFLLTRLVAFMFNAITSIIFAIVIVLEEGTLGSELVHRIFAVSFIVVGGLLFALHIGLLIQAVLYLITFLRTRIPEEWKEEPVLDSSSF